MAVENFKEKLVWEYVDICLSTSDIRDCSATSKPPLSQV